MCLSSFFWDLYYLYWRSNKTYLTFSPTFASWPCFLSLSVLLFVFLYSSALFRPPLLLVSPQWKSWAAKVMTVRLCLMVQNAVVMEGLNKIISCYENVRVVRNTLSKRGMKAVMQDEGEKRSVRRYVETSYMNVESCLLRCWTFYLYLLYMKECYGINFFISRIHILNTAYTFSHGITILNNPHSLYVQFPLKPYCKPFANHRDAILLYLITQQRVNTVEAQLCWIASHRKSETFSCW